jgi:hypothetical protein
MQTGASHEHFATDTRRTLHSSHTPDISAILLQEEIPMHAICALSESATHRQPKVWQIGTRLGGAIVATFALFGARAAHADAVTDWNAIMEATVLGATGDPFRQVRSATITQLAVFEAV